jgi:hypothetical protein
MTHSYPSSNMFPGIQSAIYKTTALYFKMLGALAIQAKLQIASLLTIIPNGIIRGIALNVF